MVGKRSISIFSFFCFCGFIIFSCQEPKEGIDPIEDRCKNIGTLASIDKPFEFPFLPEIEMNPFTEEGFELGRRLFYDERLSLNGKTSCASCHAPSKAFADDGKAKSINAQGEETKRNTMPLFNVAWGRAFAWDGKQATLEEQVEDAFNVEQFADKIAFDSIVSSDSVYVKLFNNAFSEGCINIKTASMALAQFQRAMVSGNSRFDGLSLSNYTPLELGGRNIFFSEKGDCFHCHNTSLFTDNEFRNNGLQGHNPSDEGHFLATGLTRDIGKFKTPSLRNLAYTAPYMHDGRFETLREVLDFYSTGVKFSETIDPNMKKVSEGGIQLTELEKDSLIAFLNMLNDSTFNERPEFSNPF